jgi:hypothetical protein
MADDQPNTISPEEYDRWITPHAALLVLGKHFARQINQQAIIRRLKERDIRAAARSGTVISPGGKGPLKPYWLIDPERWADGDEYHAGDAFWSNGDIAFSVPPSGYGARTTITCVEVHLEPAGIARLLPQQAALGFDPLLGVIGLLGAKYAEGMRDRTLKLAPPAPPYRAKPRERTKSVGRVDSDSLREWFKVYAAKNAGLYEGDYVKAAKAHFAPLGVGRDPVRDLIREFKLSKNRGKPANPAK